MDWWLVSGISFLALASVLILVSSAPHLVWRQVSWYVIGFLTMGLLSFVDWRWLANQSWIKFGVYGLSIALLVAAYLFAPSIRNVRSWLVFGSFQYQPSELLKLGLILVYAGFFARRHLETALFKNIFLSFLYLLPPLGLILLQPDLGSALIVSGIWVGFLLVSGITKKQFLLGVLIVILLLGVAWFSIFKPYQKERIITFLGLKSDPLGVSYNVIQSKIAIGSAGLFGKGFGQGTQTQLGFLPEAQTDFIFAAFVEEWGLVGGLFLILAFCLIIFRIIRAGLRTYGNYAKFICLGTIMVMILHFFFNVGSNVGFSPVIGVPFPFLSYGGSNLLTLFILVGIIQNIIKESSF